MQNYFKLLSFLKGHKRLFTWAVVAMFIASLFESVQLSLLVPLTDRIFTNKTIIPPSKLPPFLMNLVDHLNAIDSHRLFFYMPFVVFFLLLTKNPCCTKNKPKPNPLTQKPRRRPLINDSLKKQTAGLLLANS